MSNEYENCKRFKEETLAKQRERDGYTVEGKDARYWHAKFKEAQDGYLNLRDFANSKGLDTTTRGWDIQKDATQDGQVLRALKYCVDVIECNLKTDDKVMFKWARRIAYPPNNRISNTANT